MDRDEFNRYHKDPEREIIKDENYRQFADIVKQNIKYRFPKKNTINKAPRSNICTSYGIILVSKNDDNELVYLTCQRRHTIEYTIFILGAYHCSQLWIIFSLMTRHEKKMVLEHKDDFKFLWDNFFIDHSSKNFMEDYLDAKYKFNMISPYISKFIYLADRSRGPIFSPEWVFPKGRRQVDESGIDCALREFKEETRIDSNNIKLFNVPPIADTYLGSNNQKYCTIYYLAYVNIPITLPKHYNIRNESMISSEMSNIGWYKKEDCPVNKRQKELLNEVEEILTNIYIHV